MIKIKKGLLLLAMTLFIMLLSVSMPNNAYAEIPDGMSEEFNNILNEEGQLVITGYSDDYTRGKMEWVCAYVDNTHPVGNDYWFTVSDYETGSGQANDTATIQCNWENGSCEEHEIEIVFIEKEMSEDIESILNEEGQLVITDSSTVKNKFDILSDYLNKLSPADWSYWYSYDIGSEDTAIIMRMGENECYSLYVDEIYEIEIIYDEKFSSNFSNVIRNGKLTIPSSSKRRNEGIVTYLQKVSGKYKFEVYGLNEDCTVGTVTMSMMNDSYIWEVLEEHIVEFSYITEKNEEFKKLLNKDGKFQLNSIKPDNVEEFYYAVKEAIGEEIMSQYGLIDYGYEADDFSSFDLTAYGETHTVEVVYNYDPEIKEKMQGYVTSFPKDKEYFKVEDLELINYWVNNVQNEGNTLIEGNAPIVNYSGELKAYSDSYNISIDLDMPVRRDWLFCTQHQEGVGGFKVNDIIYHFEDKLAVKAQHIIFVPGETGNTRQELIAAAQKRINEYMGNDETVKVSYAGTVGDVMIKYVYDIWFSIINPDLTFEEFKKTSGKFMLDELEGNSESLVGVKDVKAADDTFAVTVKAGNKEQTFYVLIKKDSSKMITPSYKTADMTSGVEISSTSASVPLDTIVKVKKLVSGADYEKIMKVLKVENSETFDLKLYSDSLGKNITKIEDGKFEVKIPISEKLKGKSLAVYYVDENEKIFEHEVTVKDDYAVFTTDHFSIYTLAEKKTDVNNDETEDTSGNNSPDTEDRDNNIVLNPDTGDNNSILLITGMLLTAVIGMAVTTKSRKYCKNK